MKKLSVENLIKEFNGDIVLIDKRLRVLSSNKCNLKKKKELIGDKEYNKKLDLILKEMELLRECKEVVRGKKVVNYLDLEEDEIKELSFDSLEKGLRSLSSVKSRNICDIEKVEKIEKKYEIFKKYKEMKKDENSGKCDYKKIIECIEMIKEREEKEINKNFVISVLNGLMNK